MEEMKTMCLMPHSVSGLRQRCRGPMIDAVIDVVHGKFVSDSGKMDNDITLPQQRPPIEWLRQIGQPCGHNVRTVRRGLGTRGGDHLVALCGEIRYEMAPNKAVGAGHQHTDAVIHLSQDLRATADDPL